MQRTMIKFDRIAEFFVGNFRKEFIEDQKYEYFYKIKKIYYQIKLDQVAVESQYLTNAKENMSLLKELYKKTSDFEQKCL